METEKVCNKCGIPKPFDEFYKQKHGKFGLSGKCKSCCTEYFKNRYKNNPERVKEINENYHKRNPDAKRKTFIKYNYGITLDEYNDLLEKQNYSCGICGTSEIKRNFDVDHSHENDKIRGLLCPKCNKGIGLFNDDIELLTKAINYLKNAHYK